MNAPVRRNLTGAFGGISDFDFRLKARPLLGIRYGSIEQSAPEPIKRMPERSQPRDDKVDRAVPARLGLMDLT
jgi:hypothetical protein